MATFIVIVTAILSFYLGMTRGAIIAKQEIWDAFNQKYGDL